MWDMRQADVETLKKVMNSCTDRDLDIHLILTAMGGVKSCA
jgi:hypothetical protein